MSKLYSQAHRALQEKFDATRMADLMENGLLHREFSAEETAFLESRDMFFLSTVDGAGRPTVSYKGGPTGFVKVTGPSQIVFPSYDGNGMYYSMGNLMAAPRVGLLFIDFEKPNRLRVHGTAAIHFEHPLLRDYAEAQFLVSIDVDEIWINCPRYIPTYQKVASSKYVPQAGQETPQPAWKRIDFVQDALPAKDQGKADANGGLLSAEDYFALLAKGDA
jgi:predicted pyridoxine 5'-phosphate oxidase superfamily flavin-nucleotide-binding protein